MIETKFVPAQSAANNPVKEEKYITFLIETLHVSRAEIEETTRLYDVTPKLLAEIITYGKYAP